MKEVKKRRRKNALIVLLAMLVAVVFSGYGVRNDNAVLESFAELSVEYGSADNEIQSLLNLGAYNMINEMVLDGAISTGKAEEVLNKGYCLEYMDSWKSAGKIPSDFTPASQKSSDVTANTPTNESSKVDSANQSNASLKNAEKTYTDEEIAEAWKVVTTVEPTCVTDGYKEYKNSLTGKTKTETISATGNHSYEITDSVDATCTEKGSVTYTCSVCGDTYTEETDTLEHSYEETEQKEATCTEKGYTKYTCSVCGDFYIKDIAPTGHDNGEWSVTKEASAFSSGTKELRCTVCGDLLDTEVIPQICPIPLVGVIALIAICCVVVIVVIVAIKNKKNKEK